jgi:hypothetical protein
MKENLDTKFTKIEWSTGRTGKGCSLVKAAHTPLAGPFDGRRPSQGPWRRGPVELD